MAVSRVGCRELPLIFIGHSEIGALPGGPAFRVFCEGWGSSVVIKMKIPALSLQNRERQGRATLGSKNPERKYGPAPWLSFYSGLCGSGSLTRTGGAAPQRRDSWKGTASAVPISSALHPPERALASEEGALLTQVSPQNRLANPSASLRAGSGPPRAEPVTGCPANVVEFDRMFTNP